MAIPYGKWIGIWISSCSLQLISMRIHGRFVDDWWVADEAIHWATTTTSLPFRFSVSQCTCLRGWRLARSHVPSQLTWASFVAFFLCMYNVLLPFGCSDCEGGWRSSLRFRPSTRGSGLCGTGHRLGFWILTATGPVECWQIWDWQVWIWTSKACQGRQWSQTWIFKSRKQ